VAKSPDQATYDYNTNVELTATLVTGYHFVEWTGDASGADNPLTVKMDGDKNITANFAIDTYTLAITAENGTVEKNPDQASFNYGTAVELTATPATGYHFVEWTGDASGTANPLTVKMDGDKTITANFAANIYTITAKAGTNGNISPSGAVSVAYGTGQTFTITPDTGYHIADVLVGGSGGSSVGAVTSYTFTDVIADHTIEASFAVNTCEIIASAGEGGIITPAGRVTVNYGGSQNFVIDPNDGYHIAKVRVDGKSIGALSSYTFTNVTTNHIIKVRFASDFVRADVVIHPDTLNLKSESDEDPITAYINLPRRYQEANINVATVMLEVMGKMVPALMTHTSKDDHYDHRAHGRMVKFSLKAVILALGGQTGDIVMTVSGQLKDGTKFSGSDKVKVIDQGKKKGGHN
jgi:uncharacterized repeat protein (TIGR02543 family)